MRGLGQFALRQLSEDAGLDVSIETKAGKLTRNKLSLAESCSIEAIEGAISPSSVNQKMLDFLSRLRTDGEVVD